MNTQAYRQVRGHIDCDAFFASCHSAKDPALRDRIICVGEEIVVARSYGAKPYGIKIGTPVWEAKKMLPKDTYFARPQFGLYRYISDRLMHFLDTHVAEKEQFSIDEAFFKPHIQSYDEQYHNNSSRHLQAEIRQIIGVPVSIGIAPTRLLAKIFSDCNKPFGVCAGLQEETIKELLSSVPIGAIPFVGEKTQQKISIYCQNAYQFTQLSYEFIKNTLGYSGLVIRRELSGISATTFQQSTHPKSIGRSYSFNSHNTNNKNEIWGHLVHNLERAVDQLLYQKLKTHHLAISFRTDSFKRFGVDKRLDQATNDRIELIKQTRALFETIERGSIHCRTTGIRFTQLHPVQHAQTSLFSDPATVKKTNKLNETVQILNQKYGKGTIISASYGK